MAGRLRDCLGREQAGATASVLSPSVISREWASCEIEIESGEFERASRRGRRSRSVRWAREILSPEPRPLEKEKTNQEGAEAWGVEAGVLELTGVLGCPGPWSGLGMSRLWSALGMSRPGQLECPGLGQLECRGPWSGLGMSRPLVRSGNVEAWRGCHWRSHPRQKIGRVSRKVAPHTGLAFSEHPQLRIFEPIPRHAPRGAHLFC